MLLAVVLSVFVLIGWNFVAEAFFPPPPKPAATQSTTVAAPTRDPSNPAAGPVEGSPAKLQDRSTVLSGSARVAIDTPSLKGSINLKGARIDDLLLVKHAESQKKDSAPIRLLSPEGAEKSQFAGFGWSGANGIAVPTKDTVWQPSTGTLTPGSPVTLSWNNGQGQIFRIQYAVDGNYMFTATQSVANAGNAPVVLTPYGYVGRDGKSADVSSWTNHAGPIGVFNGAVDYDVDYEDVAEAGAGGVNFSSTGGWIGYTDHYWATVLIPHQGAKLDATFRPGARPDSYQADYRMAPVTVNPGKTISLNTRLFAGAKEANLLFDYRDKASITNFDRLISWGWFWFFEQPIFHVLSWLFGLVGNFGVAIILLTFIVRGLMFPIAQRQFASMASMRVVQPKMKALQDKYKDNREKLQQEMMKLYRDEKINPLAGCLPILLQIPVFYALYKVLVLVVEMRHQPFFGWIKDLSAPDPLTPVNLFGLIAWTPPSLIAIGVLPIIVGVTMWLQFKLNPQPMDEIQKQVFSIMPWMLMVVMAPFAAGLQLYWATSNILTIAQQKWLYSKHPALKEPIKK